MRGSFGIVMGLLGSISVILLFWAVVSVFTNDWLWFITLRDML